MESTREEIIALISMCDEKLKAAEDLLSSENLKTSVECSYYAMFNIVRAAMLTKGVVSNKHATILGQFNKKFCHTGIFEVSYARLLEKAEEERTKCSYWPGYSIDRDLSDAWHKDAVTFTGDVKMYLNQMLRGDSISDNQDLIREGALPYESSTGEYTYGEYLTWSDDHRCELIDGKVYAMSPAPSRLHQKVLGLLFREYSNYLIDKSCEVYVAPFDVRLPERDESDEDMKTVVQPDLTIICDPSKLDDKGCKGAPDLIVEVISPASIKLDISTKRSLYEKVGVLEYWVVYPSEQIVIVYTLDDQGTFSIMETYAKEDAIKVGIFDDLTITLASIFG